MDNISTLNSRPLCYLVNLPAEADRLDCEWFNPTTLELLKKTKKSNAQIKTVKLKKVCKVSGGKRLPKGTLTVYNPDNDIPYVRAVDVKNLKVDLSKSLKISKEIHHTIQNYQLKPKDLLITIAGTIGEVAILEGNFEVCDFTENVCRVRIENEKVNPYYVLHFLDSAISQIQMQRYKAGSLQYKLSLANCRNIDIPLPINSSGEYDLEKQNRILDEINILLKKGLDYKKEAYDYFKKANNVVKTKLKLDLLNKKDTTYTLNIEDNLDRLDFLFNNPEKHSIINSIKLVNHDYLKNVILPTSEKNFKISNHYKLIDLENINEITGKIANYKDAFELGSDKVILTAGDILISKLQPEKGKVAIIEKEFDGTVGSSELLTYKVKNPLVELRYLWAVLRSEYVLKQWDFSVTGSSRMRIGKKEIENTVIPIPSIKIQKEIIEEVDNLQKLGFESMEKSKVYYAESKDKFTSLIN